MSCVQAICIPNPKAFNHTFDLPNASTMTERCPFCTSSDTGLISIPEIHFNNTCFNWHRCHRCALIFVLPYLTDGDLRMLYGSDYHNRFYFKYDEDYIAQINLVKTLTGNSILDYGCGDAGLLNRFSKNGYHTTGVEYDTGLVKKLSGKFAGIAFLTVDEFWEDGAGRYDIIHLGDVLEHMNEPALLIKKLKSKLAVNGLLFIEGPLETNPSPAYFFRRGTMALKEMISKDLVKVKEPYHVTFSNATNQKILFEKAGLEEVYFKTWEQGWPYIDHFKEVKSPWLLAQWLIVKLSIAISSIIPNWGNRFYYIGKPRAGNEQ